MLLLLRGGSLGHVVAAYSFFTTVSLLPCIYIQPNTVNTFSARDMVTCPMHIASSVHCRPCRNTCCWSNTLYPCFVLPPLHSFRPGAECVQINYQNPKKLFNFWGTSIPQFSSGPSSHFSCICLRSASVLCANLTNIRYN